MPLSIEQALTPVTPHLKHRADDLLDLRDAAHQRNDPGKCLACYFKLLRARSSDRAQLMDPLRHWLEEHLEIVAQAPAAGVLERMPVQLDWQDIDHYCQNLIADFRSKKPYQHLPSVELVFQFKPLSAVA